MRSVSQLAGTSALRQYQNYRKVERESVTISVQMFTKEQLINNEKATNCPEILSTIKTLL